MTGIETVGSEATSVETAGPAASQPETAGPAAGQPETAGLETSESESVGTEREGSEPAWYPLDTTGLIFPPIISRRFTTVFRVSARLRNPVRLDVLEAALAEAYRRAPYFCVRLKRGVFWYYLEQCRPAPVQRDDGAPCMDIPQLQKDRPLILIRARGRRIAVEASHALTDGKGALTFLRALLCRYSARVHDTGHRSWWGDAAEDSEPLSGVHPRQWETRYADSDILNEEGMYTGVDRYTPAWHLPGLRVPRGQYRVTTGRYRVKDLRAHARQRGVSITDFCLAVFVYVLQQRYHATPPGVRTVRPIRILVPVDLRGVTGVATMRNFFVPVMVEVDQRLGFYELDEIAHNVHHQLRAQRDPRTLKKQVRRNVRARGNWFNRLIPRLFKDPILRFVFRTRGEAVNTGSFSNLGSVELPPRVRDDVESFDFFPPPSPVTGLNLTLVSFGDIASITFGSTREGVEVERGFFRTLAGLGVHGSLVVNWR